MRARAVILAVDEGDRVALLVKGSDPEDDMRKVSVEVVSDSPDAGGRVAEQLRSLTLRHNVYRGQVVSFGHSMFGERAAALRFHRRQPVAREALVLPQATYDDVRRQVVGVARDRDRLGELTDTTVVELTGPRLQRRRRGVSRLRPPG